MKVDATITIECKNLNRDITCRPVKQEVDKEELKENSCIECCLFCPKWKRNKCGEFCESLNLLDDSYSEAKFKDFKPQKDTIRRIK